MGIDFSLLTPSSELAGDSAEDTELLSSILEHLHAYLAEKNWCDRVSRSWFGEGVGGVVGVFLFEATMSDGEIEYLWMIGGDLPTAYLEIEGHGTPVEALNGYCELMSCWADVVLEGGDLSTVFPVEATATKDNAMELRDRIDFLRREVIPWMSNL